MIEQVETSKNSYAPLLPEDTTFCELDECGDIATWKCYPPNSLTRSTALCDRCKQEVQRQDMADQDMDEEITDWQAMREDLQAMRSFLFGLVLDLILCLGASLLLTVLFIMVLPFYLLAFLLRTCWFWLQ